jgi:GNAT superfamily N-acetyltransferase
MDLTIRTATAADEDAALALIEELFKPPGARAPGYSSERGREGFRAAVESPDADVLLAASDDGRLLGLASVYADIKSIRYGKRCWLQDLVVTADMRSSGIGKRLLDAATEWARERGCTHLELGSGIGRAGAHRFYLREGMTQGYTFQRWIG